MQEANKFYEQLIAKKNKDQKNKQLQADAGVLWKKQFYYMDSPSW